MFLDTLKKRNSKLIEASFHLHKDGAILPNTYVIDVDMFLENAKNILNKANENNIKLYYMLKQVGRNPYLGKKLEDMGYAGAVVVDFQEAEVMIKNNLKIGHIGHLVQTPSHFIKDVLINKPEIITVYSYEKAEEISNTAASLDMVQDIMIRVISEESNIYPGQEAGFEMSELKSLIDKIVKLKNVRLAGLTSFPCFLYDSENKKIKATPNIDAINSTKIWIENNYDIKIEQINLPSATSLENIHLIKEYGGTHGEPGHALSGTCPINADIDNGETPSYIYVSEISHNFRDKSYFYGGGYYRRSNMKNALVGNDINNLNIVKVNPFDPENIDYYLELDTPQKVSDTVLSCFRTQFFVTRSNVCLVEGIQKNTPNIIGLYTSLGERI